MKNYCPISGESEEEEKINFYTHLAGFILSIVGWVVLLYYVIALGDFWHIFGCVVYGATLVTLYGVSTFYHKCTNVNQKKVLRIIDHASIYLFIAGSYTPFTLGPLRHYGGLELLFIVWTIALTGISLKVLYIHRFELVSVIAYLAMGWLVVFNFSSLMDNLSMTALIWLFAGGISYSIGTIFYLWESLPYNHAIWHIFVLGGSTCHYCSILNVMQQQIS